MFGEHRLHARALSTLLFGAALVIGVADAAATGLHSPEGAPRGVEVRQANFDISLDGVFADASMTLVVERTNPKVEEANVRFPLPTDAALYESEVFLPDQDRWETARTSGRRHSSNARAESEEDEETVPANRLLVEHIGRDFYRARAPFVAGEDVVRFRIRYAHTLQPTESGLGLSVAMANPDSAPSAPSQGLKINITAEPDAWSDAAWATAKSGGTFQADVETGRYSAAFGATELDSDISLELTPSETLRSDAIRYVPQTDAEPHTAVWWHPDIVEEEARPPRNLVFVLDRSGSMSGRKLAEAKLALTRALEQLEEGDRFGVVTFSDDVTEYASKMHAIGRRDEAASWLEQVEAGGATNVGAALERAIEIGVTSELDSQIDVVLLTDGNPTEGPESAEGILQRLRAPSGTRNRARRVFACGIGTDLSHGLIDDIADATDGTAVYALYDAELFGSVMQLVSWTRPDAVHRGRIEVTSGDAAENYQPPFFLPGESFVVGHRSRADSSVVELFEADREPELLANADIEAREESKPIAAALAAGSWAHRIAREIDDEGEEPPRVLDAVKLGMTYGQVTRYTSHAAYDSEASYEEYGIPEISRDEAGIATGDLPRAMVDESRIGGMGTYDSMIEPQGCSVAEGSTPRKLVSLLMLVAFLLGSRLRRRMS